MSVSIDQLKNKNAALAFLVKQNAAFTNVLFDEPPKVIQEQFDIYGVPAALVFDRDGKLAKRFDNNDPRKSYTHVDVEAAVQKLLSR